ncbi:LysR family transcriptional regulator [Magnetovibrio sp. PR-2]|uniref:LysR family transcriptional regulator n=1 Tax=Magnetovibrio sp. PR-2 TaxID=3120356 RepID=UPI002FCE4B50
MDTFSAMRAFITTVDKGSFSGAARALGTSKATLSKQVAALEDHLNVRLLHRTTRKLNLTDEGRIYVDRARQILEDLEDAEDAVSPSTAEPRGKLRISAPHTFGAMHLSNALACFVERYPLVELDIEFSDRLVNLVDEGFDLAIRISKLKDSSLIARRLAPVNITLCAAPSYWERRGKPNHPSELSEHTGIIYSFLSTPGEWHFQDKGKPLSVKMHGNLTTNNDVVIRAAAQQGIGIFYGPAFIVSNALRKGELETALEDYSTDPLGIYAVYPSSRNLSPKVRAFVDYLVEWMRHTPDWEDVSEAP